MIQGLKTLSATGSKETPISVPHLFLAMNLLTQVVCVSGVNKLTSVRGKHALDRPTRFLISNISPGDLISFYQRGSYGQKGCQSMPEYMVLWKRLELLACLWSWDGICRFVDVLDCWTVCSKQEGIDSPPFGIVKILRHHHSLELRGTARCLVATGSLCCS